MTMPIRPAFACDPRRIYRSNRTRNQDIQMVQRLQEAPLAEESLGSATLNQKYREVITTARVNIILGCIQAMEARTENTYPARYGVPNPNFPNIESPEWDLGHELNAISTAAKLLYDPNNWGLIPSWDELPIIMTNLCAMEGFIRECRIRRRIHYATLGSHAPDNSHELYNRDLLKKYLWFLRTGNTDRDIEIRVRAMRRDLWMVVPERNPKLEEAARELVRILAPVHGLAAVLRIGTDGLDQLLQGH